MAIGLQAALSNHA